MNNSKFQLGLESVKVTEPPRPSAAVQPEKKLPALNLSNFPQSPPPVPPHEPSPLNGEVRRHRKHCRPTSNSPSKRIAQTSSAISQHQRIPNGKCFSTTFTL